MRHLRTAVCALAAVVLWLALNLPVFAEIPDTDLAFLAASSPPVKGTSAFFPSMLRPILAVLFLGALMWGALYLMYRRRAQESLSVLIHVLVSSQIAQGVIIQIVDVGGIFYVLALSRDGVTPLGQITDREKISEIRTRVSKENLSPAAPAIPFRKALQKWFPRQEKSEQAAARPAAREKLLQEVLERVRRLNPTQKGDE